MKLLVVNPNTIARAREKRVRLIGYDRPGYGGSDRYAGRNIADCASDVRAIAGALVDGSIAQPMAIAA